GDDEEAQERGDEPRESMQHERQNSHRETKESSFRAPALPAQSRPGGGREECTARRATTAGRGTESPSGSSKINPADLLPVADGAEADTLEALGPGAEVLGVVDPDARRLVHHDARRVLVRLLAHLAVGGFQRYIEELVDLRILVEARRLERAPLAGVEHLADPVVGIGVVGADPVDDEVG